MLPVLRHDRLGFRDVLEESVPVVLLSKDVLRETPAWGKLSFDARDSLLAAMERSPPDLSGVRACRFQLEQSL